MSRVTSIALTGGPCGGKTTSISILEQELTNKGYKVFVVEEMATNIIKSGAGPADINYMTFQCMMVALQDKRNQVYESMANEYAEENNKDVVIIYDRGIPDCKGFLTDDEYSQIIKAGIMLIVKLHLNLCEENNIKYLLLC